MIRFLRIKYKNFFSIGNFPIEVDLTANHSTLIIGTNGVGKSTFVSAICFALYGKPYKEVLKGSIINSINKKDLLVEIDFEIGSEKYKIIRGMKPNIFEIYLNDVLLNVDNKAVDYQEHLEKNIIKMSFHTFKQIVVIGNSGFTPFLQLPTGQRRDMIENILDMTIFSTMNVLCKDDVNHLNIRKQNLEREIFELGIKIDAERDKIKFIEEQNKNSDRTVQRQSILDQITPKQNLYNKIPAEFPNLTPEVIKLNDTIRAFDKKETSTRTELAFLDRETHLLSCGTCPTCKQEIAEGFKAERMTAIEAEKGKKSDLLKKIEKAKNAVDTSLAEKQAKIDKQNQLVNMREKLEYELSTLKAEIARLEEDVELSSIKPNLDEIEELTGTLNVKTDEQAAATKDIELRKQALQVLKDNGVKSKIIRTYIPLINLFINEYLEEMNFYVSFEIDENFDETIKSRHRDVFTYNNFSDGEKARIDLAFLFAWRKISKLRNGISTNLLILDEVFSGSLDASGIDDLNLILKNLDDSNVFVITHRLEGAIEKFESVIEFIKIMNFTQISRNNNDI